MSIGIYYLGPRLSVRCPCYRVFFKENIRESCREIKNCPQYRGGRIREVSVPRGSTYRICLSTIGFYGNVNIHITATLHLLKCYQVNLRKQKLLQLFWSHLTLHLGGPWLTWEVPLCEACHPSQLRRVRGTLQHISVWGYILYPGITRVRFVRSLRPSDLGPVYMAVGDPRYVR